MRLRIYHKFYAFSTLWFGFGWVFKLTICNWLRQLNNQLYHEPNLSRRLNLRFWCACKWYHLRSNTAYNIILATESFTLIIHTTGVWCVQYQRKIYVCFRKSKTEQRLKDLGMMYAINKFSPNKTLQTWKSWRTRTKYIITRSRNTALSLTCKFCMMMYPVPHPHFAKFKNTGETWRDTTCFWGPGGETYFAYVFLLWIGNEMRRFSGGACSWKFHSDPYFDGVLGSETGWN